MAKRPYVLAATKLLNVHANRRGVHPPSLGAVVEIVLSDNDSLRFDGVQRD